MHSNTTLDLGLPQSSHMRCQKRDLSLKGHTRTSQVCNDCCLLIKTTLAVKTLLFLVHLCSQQKRTQSHLQLSNLQCCHFDIVILRAIISNVQDVIFSVDTDLQMMPRLVDGMVYNRLVQQTMTHLLPVSYTHLTLPTNREV